MNFRVPHKYHKFLLDLNIPFAKYDSIFIKKLPGQIMTTKNAVVKLLLILSFLPLTIQLHAQTFRSDIFKERRSRLLKSIEDSSIAIFNSAKTATRNGDVDYKYRQNSNFYYLTGFEEPGSAFILLPTDNKKFVMFVRQSNILMESWTGKRAGLNGAIKTYGADTAYGIGLFSKMLTKSLKGKKKIYLDTEDKDLVKLVDSLYKKANENSVKQNINVNDIVNEMRLIKDNFEIDLMRRACEITSDALINAYKNAKPGQYEYEIQAALEYIYTKNGSNYPAFISIVGSGVNSTILHYEENNKIVEDGDMIVMDVGAEYKNYASDITRSIPANGNFSDEQKLIYDIVLKALKETTSFVKPGIGLNELQQYTSRVITDGLLELGLITDKEKNWQTNIWMPHGTSHWVGLDVHDVGDSKYMDKKGRLLEPGMVFTIEPGIYVSKNIFNHLKDAYGFQVSADEIKSFTEKVKDNVAKFANIGIRIEDTILVTKDGCEVLSRNAPKEIDDIEKIMTEKK
ncbi:MAG: M24 family metallopeptidase [Ignavibacteriales bacterium]|nr:MAG: M24 family metallopeptidase [Ignavibacteriales bacterium]